MADPRPDADTNFVEELDEPMPFRKGRRVVTQPVDLAVRTLVDQIDDKSLVLATDFQRKYVWDNAKASRLIESLLLNVPIPVCYFAEDQQGTYEVVDGHQRLHSIWRYLKEDFRLGRLEALPEQAGLRFSRLPGAMQLDLSRRTIRCVVITRESDPELKFEIFERLNTNAVPLNAQELRNCVYRGALNDLLKALVVNSDFRRALGRRQPDYRMRDHELILRFFAIQDDPDAYAPPLKSFLNGFIARRRVMDPGETERLSRVFADTIAAVASVFGTAAFRLLDTSGRKVEDGVNRALFDAQMVCLSRIPRTEADGLRVQIRRGMGRLCEDAQFLEAIGRATADRSRLLTRIRMTAEMLQEAGVERPYGLDLRPE